MLQLLCDCATVMMRMSHFSGTRARCEELKDKSYAQGDSAERVRGLLERRNASAILHFIF